MERQEAGATGLYPDAFHRRVARGPTCRRDNDVSGRLNASREPGL